MFAKINSTPQELTQMNVTEVINSRIQVNDFISSPSQRSKLRNPLKQDSQKLIHWPTQA